MAAFAWLKREYLLGRRTRPTICEACGQDQGTIMAHSEDYSSPYGDHIGRFSLCFRCHMMVHSRGRSSAAFWHYVRQLEDGWVYPGLTWREGFNAIRRDRSWRPTAAPPAGSVKHERPLGDPSVLRRIADGAYKPGQPDITLFG